MIIRWPSRISTKRRTHQDHPAQVTNPDCSTGQQTGVTHAGAIRSICAFKAKRGHIVVGGGDATLRAWDAATGRQRWVHTMHDGPIYATCAIPGEVGTLLATAGAHDAVDIWNPVTGEIDSTVPLYGHHPVRRLSYLESVGARILVMACDDGTVRLYDLDDRTVHLYDLDNGLRRELYDDRPMTAAVTAVSAFPYGDDAILVTGADNGSLTIDNGSWIAYLSPYRQILAALNWRYDGRDDLERRFYQITSDRTYRQMLTEAGWRRDDLEQEFHRIARLLRYSQMMGDEQEALSEEDWSHELGLRRHRAVHEGEVFALSPIHFRGQTFLATAGIDRTVQIWDLARVYPRKRLEGHAGAVRAVCQFKVGDKDLLVSAGDDKTARIWDPDSGNLIQVIRLHHPALSIIQVANSLVLGLSSGLLVIQPNLER